MKIGFIGAGKVGFSLGRYFYENGLQVVGYYSKNYISAKAAADFTQSEGFKTLREVVEVSDMIFVTTPDDCIKNIWEKMNGYDIKNKIICHCSGSLASTIFENSTRYKVYSYAIHPLYAINSKQESYKHLREAYFSIEGSSEKIDEITGLFKRLGNPYQIISAEHKSLYHAAAVTVSNQIIGLLSQGVQLMMQCGFEEEMALKALWPLIEGNIKNIKDNGLLMALTGPVERGDLETIKKHLKVLKNEDQEIYCKLSLKVLDIAKKKHPNQDYELLSRLLEQK